MDPCSDELLVEESKRGSREAFTELVQRHQGAVYSLCYRTVGNPTEAEDLAQEAFLRLYRSLDRFRRGARLRPWLHRIAVNACLDALRKRKEPMLSLDGMREGGTEPPIPHGGTLPEEACLDRELQAAVQQALLQLPGDYRIALVLRYLEDLSYREVADALGVPLSTVETRIFRAKKMLGQVLSSPTVGGKEGA
ncbi:MAG TPA: sigma-70 family RNA polymerase sigma factor [Anaerolineae bacterium]|nr:sigma-70 family RNA polymerase sigma factor [Anaerolineae bacterium]HOQ97191.1 sigma-70 family RNA polymerase sigma factor [Anaerolineae bacterium]HPL26417.1 sigma-70 family RNA polymerase sigma factor [Anaerolineae bacterium]